MNPDNMVVHLEVGRNERLGRGQVVETACGRRWNGWQLRKRGISKDPSDVTCGLCKRSNFMNGHGIDEDEGCVSDDKI